MSNALLPSFPGLSWGGRRAVRWNTTIRRAASGREYRAANWSSPVYEYPLDYELLRQHPNLAELEQLLGFVNLRQGSFDSFLSLDPHDQTATAGLRHRRRQPHRLAAGAQLRRPCRAGAGHHRGAAGLHSCQVPCDHVPIRSWALIRARDVMRGVIESLKQEDLACLDAHQT